jgi:uncharacterized protein (DUF486 family)
MLDAESEMFRLAPKRPIRISRSNGASAVLAGVRFISDNGDRHARGACLALCPADPDADRLQYLHDRRLVLAPALQEVPLLGVILVSWLLAFVEYCLAVPANRWGNAVYTAAQLKTMQEVITLVVFAGFSVVYLQQAITWNHAVGFALIAAGAFFVFRGPL